jgi:peroxiredoxin
MSVTVNCPHCNAALELPGDIPAGKRLQCPDCGESFAPPGAADLRTGLKAAPTRPEARVPVPAPPAARTRTRRREDSVRHDRDRAPRRRSKVGAVALLLSVLVILLLSLGVAGLVVAAFYSDTQNRSVVEKGHPAPAPAPPAVPNGPGGAMPGMFPQPGGMGFPAQPVSLKIGDLAPEIDGTDLDGKPMKLSDFRDKVVVLEFWGDWSPTKSPYPYFNHLLNRLKDEPFVLLGVNTDTTLERARQVAKEQKIGWRSWWDGGLQLRGPLCQRYGVTAVPTTFVIDKKGIIRQQFPGTTIEFLLDRKVDETLALGEDRPPGAPPRWQPGSTAFGQLADEVAVGPYRVRLPQGYAPDTSKAPAYRWKGPPRPDGSAAEFVVTLTPAGPADPKLEEILEKDLEKISPNSRLGFSSSAAERGEVKGLTFVRTRWTLMENSQKIKEYGFLYAARDGDTLIRIAYREPVLNFNGPLEAAALSFHKAVK